MIQGTGRELKRLGLKVVSAGLSEIDRRVFLDSDSAQPEELVIRNAVDPISSTT